jgi:DNA topoisomerase I
MTTCPTLYTEYLTFRQKLRINVNTLRPRKSHQLTMKLLIVESPAKCKKIQEYLGSAWRVQATMGHIRALKEELEAIGFPAKGKGVPTWNPIYESLDTKRDAIASLKRAAASAEVYLGSDDDREGEAIAWHTCVVLGLDPTTTPRVRFHEITKPALQAAVDAPGRIDMNKFNAQQARSMLDLLIGFTLSPCLWRGVGYKAGLSAGRCQTPALRIIYDRDVEIEKHTSQTVWKVAATSAFDLEWKSTETFESDTKAFDSLKVLAPAPNTLSIKDRTERVSTSKPPLPFITSSLQQEASNRLGMNPKRTMQVAQKLYEAGHITYMRTDSAVLSAEAQEAAEAIVKERWGESYVMRQHPSTTDAESYVMRQQSTGAEEEKPAKKTTKKKATKKAEAPEAPEAQAAHEGIRPTHMETETIDDEGQSLYKLIWTRTIQSVMAPEKRDVVKLSAVPTVKPDALTLTTEWDRTAFAGWRILDTERRADAEAAAAAAYDARASIAANTEILWTSFTATETRTAPPPRYTEASLIRELESRGIGRPSTFATLVETVVERGYVEKSTIAAAPITLRGLLLEASKKIPKQTTRTEKAGGEKDKLRTTALGRTVIEWLLSTFDDMVDYGFTAAMEQQLDEVAKGTRPWASLLNETWNRYKERYCTVMDAKPATSSSSKAAEFGDGYKMVISKKGPLFVLEREGEKTRFASVPAHLSITTATRTDAEAAFAAVATTGETLGTLDGKPVVRKKGPYGYYVAWGDIKLNCKPDETLEELTPRLQAKVSVDTVDHQVGEYKIKKGPYGLYMYKSPPLGSKTKPKFVGIPDTTPWATLTPESAAEIYKHCAAAKKEAKAKPRAPRKKASAEA